MMITAIVYLLAAYYQVRIHIYSYVCGSRIKGALHQYSINGLIDTTASSLLQFAANELMTSKTFCPK